MEDGFKKQLLEKELFTVPVGGLPVGETFRISATGPKKVKRKQAVVRKPKMSGAGSLVIKYVELLVGDMYADDFRTSTAEVFTSPIVVGHKLKEELLE